MGMGGAGAPGGWGAPARTEAQVLCCICGVAIAPNPAAMCAGCLRSRVDVTEGVQRQVTVLWCKGCSRYLQPPKTWISAELESKELLTFCLKRIRGLSKVKLVDAGFVWTEPHSRRLKTKLTVQKEVYNGTILQQSFVVEFVVEGFMCEHCTRAAGNPNQWVAVVQVRQKLEHKKTFFFLEQLILKHGAQDQAINIKEVGGGIDFYYGNRSHAIRMVDFLNSVVPIRHRNDKSLISHDTHSNTYNYRYTFMVEIVPVCKDDLLLLPPKVCTAYGNFGPLTLCTRVNNAFQLLDLNTLKRVYMDSNAFWREPFKASMTSRQLTEFVVLDIELVENHGGQAGAGVGGGKLQMAEAEVARVTDFGVNDITFHCRTHLGHLLNPGDHVLGFDVCNTNVADRDLDIWMGRGLVLPDVVLVRKSYEESRRRRKAKGYQRDWRLKGLDMEVEETGFTRQRVKAVAAQEEQEKEQFLRDLEEDPEMRSRINIYKNPEKASARPDLSDDEGEGDVAEVKLEEMLDELSLGPDEAGAASSGAGGPSGPGMGGGGLAAGEEAEDMDME